jgi:hypothetical protein
MQFYPYNISDTCAVWNVLSSATLYKAALNAGCYFACTSFVVYECLTKARKTVTSADTILRERLTREKELGRFQEFHSTLAELEDIALLQRRRRLGKGELSSIALARRARQAFMTDDRKAKRLANEVCDAGMCQTTPELLGWLFFIGALADADLSSVLREHAEVSRPLAASFQDKYREALQYRLISQRSA